ncbi:MAG TPA: hypothetical protein PLI96_03750 [Halothiobacillus sp.]|nr:hypothetical protein [Halothiobacillus sp.]
MSYYLPIFYVDISTREGMSLEETIQQARGLEQQRRESGYDQAALDQAAQQGFANGVFEDTEEEVTEIIEEFFPPLLDGTEANDAATTQEKPSLTNKLNRKTQNLTETGI